MNEPGRSSVRSWGCSSVAVSRLIAVLTGGILVCLSFHARAGEEVPSMVQGDSDSATQAAVRAGAFLPLTLAPSVGGTAATVVGYGGYDSSRPAAVSSAIAEVALWGPLALRAGSEYGSDSRFRPTIGLRAQLLQQSRHAIDGSISVFYRAEGFNEPEGEIETFVSIGRRFGDSTLIGNIVYGQDPEGNERDGEVRLAAFHTRNRWLLGVEGRARFAIGAQHTAKVEPAFDSVVGAVTMLRLGPLAALAEAGPAVLNLANQTRVGWTAIAGLGAAL